VSRRLLVKFITEFVKRYRDRPTIAFYELTNELNLLADLDVYRRRCGSRSCVWSNFTTREMSLFARDVVRLLKSLDTSRRVASGYSLPRPGAAHLAERSEFSPSGPDWTPDTAEEMADHLVAVHSPFDIISVHIYPSADDDRYGRPSGEQYRLVADAQSAATAAGKPLFIGEFGDTGATPFMRGVLDQIVENRVAYAAIWVWEFYQTSTADTRNTDPTRYEVEPSYSRDVIALLMQAQRRLGHAHPLTNAIAPPRVVLTWPLPCASLDRPVDITAVASDGVKPVSRVEFLLDGKFIASVNAPPYKVHFDPTGRPARIASFTAHALSESGIAAEFHSSIRLNGAAGQCPAAP
jgi:hypothetical protein